MKATEFKDTYREVKRHPIITSGKISGIDIDGDGQINRKKGDVELCEISPQDFVALSNARETEVLTAKDTVSFGLWKGRGLSQGPTDADRLAHSMAPLSRNASWAVIVPKDTCGKPTGTIDFVVYEPKS